MACRWPFSPSVFYHLLSVLYLFPNLPFLKILIYLLVALLGLHCPAGFSLVVATGGYSAVVGLRLLITVASLVVEHGLSCSMARGIFQPGIETMFSALAGEFLTTRQAGNALVFFKQNKNTHWILPPLLMKTFNGTFLVVQWLRLCSQCRVGMGFDPWLGN